MSAPKEAPRPDGFRPMSPWENFPFLSSPSELDPDGIPYEVMRFPDAAKMTGELARQILASEQQFDAVVYPLRGGLYSATRITQAVLCPAYPIGLRLYQGIQARDEVRQQEVEIYQPLPPDVDFSDKRILGHLSLQNK